MKIAFVGKGGSGKTTITALLARSFAYNKKPVLAIDADINQHLASSLHLTTTPPPLGNEIQIIKKYLKGTNPRISSVDAMIKTTPPGQGSHLLSLSVSNTVFDYFMHKEHGLQFMAVGAFTEDDLGIKCYHSKTGSVELILNHLIDTHHEYVLVDMTAGSDAFASGLFTRFDTTFLIVEPTLKSVEVYKQYKAYAATFNVDIKVIGNKVEKYEDLEFINNHVGDDLVASFSRSPFILASEKGKQLPFDALEQENKKALEAIQTYIDSRVKDWKKYLEQAIYFHKKNATSWANAQVGEDLTQQIDPTFVYTV